MSRRVRAALAALMFGTLAAAASAQEATIAFSGLKANAGEPVEITADQLEMAQQSNDALFTGNVLVRQGDIRLASATLRVVYADANRSQIDRMIAEGDVLLTSPTEAAEARQAVYTLGAGEIEMTGDVLLTQAGNVMSGEKLIVDIEAGAGRMEGRVKTILQPQGN